MKHLFIVNPAAGRSDRTAEISAKAAELFAGRENEFDVYVTKGPMDAPEAIKRAAAEGGELRVYSCGGDGTYNECVCGAAGLPNVAVTPYATGTGNDFILIPDYEGELDVTPEHVRYLCDRHFGLGADGVIRVVRTARVPEVASMADSAEWFMDYRNADGSISLDYDEWFLVDQDHGDEIPALLKALEVIYERDS